MQEPFLPTIALHTFVAITGLMGCLMSLVLFFLKKSYPASIKGMGDWSIFPVLTFFASLLYSLQGKWHHLLSMALPNLLVVLTLVTQLRGTYKHFGKQVNTRLLLAIIFISLLLAVWTSGKNEYFVHRLVYVSSLTALMLGAQLSILWHHRRGSFASHFMLLTLVMMCIAMSMRAATALIDPPAVGIFSYSPLQAFYLASFGFGVLLLSIAAILLSAEQLRNEMTKLLRYDTLTKALTRRAAFEYGEDELARSNRRGTAFSVLLLDLDHFKDINDKHGHQVGDRVLRDFVQSVGQVLRHPSAIGRYGGEEFVILLPDTTMAQAVAAAERIQSHLRASAAQPKVATSIGVASFVHGQHDNLDALIGRADAALYRAKQQGRDRIEVNQQAGLPLP